MQPTNPSQPTDINAILQLLAQSAGQAQQNAGTFSDMLRQRREFVQGGENQSADAASQALQNGGQDGVRISSADATAPLFNFHTDNANKTAELTQQMFGYQGQANDLLKSIAALGGDQANRDVQLRGQNLQYGIGDANGNASSSTAPGSASAAGGTTGLNGAQAIDQVHNQHGDDILATATSDADRYRIAQQVLAAGGVANYRKAFNDPIAAKNQDAANMTNSTLQTITHAQDQLTHSAALKSVLSSPWQKGLAELAINSGHQEMLKGQFGLSDQDVKALGELSALNAIGDKSLIGGRLTGTLTNALSPSQPGLSKSADQNLVGLKQLKANLTTSMANYAKQYGYKSAYDIPGIAPFKVKMSNGQTGSIHPLEYDPSQMQLQQ